MAIKLAFNYLLELEELLKEGKVDVDYVKFPAINGDMAIFEQALKLGKPVLYHSFPPFDWNIGNPNMFEKFDIEVIKNNIKRAGCPYLSGHVAVVLEQYGIEPKDIDTISHDTVLKNFQKNIKQIKEGLEMNIALENTMSYPYNSTMPICSDPSFISEVVYSTDSYLLLDIAHANVHARNNGMTVEQFLEKLPLDRLWEIHINGYGIKDGRYCDMHGKILEDEYELLKDLVKIPSLRTVTIEYGPNSKNKIPASYEKSHPELKEEVYEQINRVREIIYG